MKLRDYIVIGAMIAAAVLALHLLKGDPSVPSDPGKEQRDSLKIQELLQALRAKEIIIWADSLDRVADSMEARALPPETLYRYHHEESLTADTSAMYRYMGQMPRDTAITR